MMTSDQDPRGRPGPHVAAPRRGDDDLSHGTIETVLAKSLLPLVGAMMTLRGGGIPDVLRGLLPLVGAMMTGHQVEQGGEVPQVAAPRRGDDDLVGNKPGSRESFQLLPLVGAMMTWNRNVLPGRYSVLLPLVGAMMTRSIRCVP